MKKTILTLAVALLAVFSSWAQGPADTVFTLVAEWNTTAQLTDSTFSVNANHPADQLGQGFLPTQIQVGYRAFDAFGRLFEITAVGSADFGSSSLTVKELQDNNTGPGGVGLVYRPLDSGLIPVPPGGNTGLAPATLARLHIHNVANGGAGGTTTEVLEDSILVFKLYGSEVGRDTIRSNLANYYTQGQVDSTIATQISGTSGRIAFYGDSGLAESGNFLYDSTSRALTIQAFSNADVFNLIRSDGKTLKINASAGGYDLISSSRFEIYSTAFDLYDASSGDGTLKLGNTGSDYGQIGNNNLTARIYFSGSSNGSFIRFDTESGPSSIIDNGALGVGMTSPSYSLDVNGTDGIRIPTGTTAQQPLGADGVLRYNTDTDEFEGWNGATSAFDGLAWESDLITNNTTTGNIPYWDGDSFENTDLGYNGSKLTLGPLTINGNTVTVFDYTGVSSSVELQFRRDNSSFIAIDYGGKDLRIDGSGTLKTSNKELRANGDVAAVFTAGDPVYRHLYNSREHWRWRPSQNLLKYDSINIQLSDYTTRHEATKILGMDDDLFICEIDPGAGLQVSGGAININFGTIIDSVNASLTTAVVTDTLKAYTVADVAPTVLFGQNGTSGEPQRFGIAGTASAGKMLTVNDSADTLQYSAYSTSEYLSDEDLTISSMTSYTYVIRAEISTSPGDEFTITLPTASANYAGRTVTIVETDANTGDSFLYNIVPASGNLYGSDGASVGTTTITNETKVFRCMPINSSTWAWYILP